MQTLCTWALNNVHQTDDPFLTETLDMYKIKGTVHNGTFNECAANINYILFAIFIISFKLF